jgi:hypothetical protein
MSPSESPDDSTSLLKELRQQLSKRLAEGIIVLLGAVAVGLLHAYGESTFDLLVHALGKTKLLQIVALLLCLLGYCVFWIVKMKRDKLVLKRSLYWMHGDKSPLCAFCYDTGNKRVHLNWKTYYEKEKQKDVECWQCYNCNHDYVAWHGKDFAIRKVHQRL